MQTTDESINVLHVDDEPELAEMAATFIEREDERFEVETATSANEGLDRLADDEHQCVVSDYDMPGQNGIEFLETVRETHPDLPFILYTGKGSEEVASDAISAGATDYLQKETGSGQYELLANRIDNAVSQARSKQAERHLGELVEGTDQILYMFAYDWSELLFINAAYEDIWGQSIETLQDDPSDFLAGVHPDDRDRVRGAMDDMSAGETVELEYRVNPDENYGRWVRAHGTPIRDESGTVTRVAGFATDITEQKRQQRTLEKHEQLVNSLPNPTAIYDSDGCYELVNQALADLRDATPKDLIGDPSPHMERIRDEHEDDLVQTLLDGDRDVIRGEYTAEFANGDQRTFEYLYTPLGVGNDTRSIVGSTREITERKERERELERYRTRVEEAFETVDIPTLVLDAKGDVVVWNWALEQLLEIDREEVADVEDIGRVVYDGEREAILAEKVVANPRSADDIHDIERADSEYGLLDAPGQPTYEDTSTVVGGSGEDIWFLATPLYRDGDFFGVIEFIQKRSDSERQRREMGRLMDELFETLTAFQEGDYSDRVDHDVAEGFLDDEAVEAIEEVNEMARMRQRLRDQVRKATDAKRQLERQNKRLNEFTGVVSHDLRNPLGVAEGRLELAREECDSEHLDTVATAHDRMETLIEDLLTLAREGGRVSDMEPVDLAELSENCWQNVETADSTIRTSIDRTIQADQSRLAQLLENLMRNAVEHGGEDMTITVGELYDGFFVEDAGPGIPEDERDDVFDAGYSTSEDGTGFGLSIVKQVAEAHEWDIRVTEGSDGGARFEITGVGFTE